MQHLVTREFITRVQAAYAECIALGFDDDAAIEQVSHKLCSNRRLLADLVSRVDGNTTVRH